MNKISAVINALNAESSIERLLKSLSWVDEIIVVDDGSLDKTVEIAKRYTKKIFHHKSVGFVEPARNYAISKASGDWIFILDTDEEVPSKLADKLIEVSLNGGVISFIEIPRRNIIFGKWMKASMWWPDYNIRFFKKGAAVWSNKIHSKPELSGQGLQLLSEEDLAILHYNYDNLSQFIERMDRYTTVQAKELCDSGYLFNWSDLIVKPLDEFLSRFFANRGFEDGLHGLALSLLQAFSFLLVYLKVWEKQKFVQQDINLSKLREVSKKSGTDISYWFKYGDLSKNPLKRFLQKAKNKVT